MATIQDVARRAGVSPMTVSRVVNASGYASREVRERVLAAVAELGYRPNTLARSLRIRRSQTLALILTDITNPFFTTIARGVEDAASAAGYTVIFGNTDESEEKQQIYLEMIQQKQVDGILLVPAGEGLAAVERIRRSGTPLVVLDRRVAGEGVDGVRCDTQAGARRLAELLLGLGHRQVTLLTGPADVSTAEDRAAGFRQAMQAAGIAGAGVIYGHFTPDSGYQMTRQALANQPRPTALIAGNNFIAIGVLKALRDAGLDVPADLAVVAFDDLPAALLVDPFLTVAVQPAYEMGRRAANLLLERIAAQNSAPPQEILLPLDLIVRRSSGKGINHGDTENTEKNL